VPLIAGVLHLEPGSTGFIDIAKTREIVMRCFVNRAKADGTWVVVPHLGCSHQHSKFALTVFADQPVAIEDELQPWQRRVVASAWSPLCSAPNSIADIMWRNCPQFQLINMGASRVPVRALLSYAERDDALSKRHLQALLTMALRSLALLTMALLTMADEYLSLPLVTADYH
jgi:hypothetical protein